LTSGGSPAAQQFVSGPLTTQTGPVFYLDGDTLYFDPDGITKAQDPQALVILVGNPPMSEQDIVL